MGLPKAISLCTLCDGKLSDINSCDTPLNTTWTTLFPSPDPFRCCQLPFCERYIGNQHWQGCGKATSGQTNIDFCLNLLIYLLSLTCSVFQVCLFFYFCQQLGLNCAVTAGSRVSQSRGADDRASVGSEVWLCRSELNAGIGMGKISVLGYSRGRCYHKKVNICENAMLIFNLVWVCQTGLGKGSDSRVSSRD